MSHQTILIGEQHETMHKIAQGMMNVGVSSRVAGSVESLLHEFPSDQVDTIVIGRYLSKKKSTIVEQAWHARKPDVHIMYIKVPIGELIGETIKAHLFRASNQEPIASMLSLQRKHVIHFSTNTTSNIDIVLYRYTFFLRRKMFRIHHEVDALSGRQIIQIPRRALGFGGERFAVITINDNEKHVLSIR